MASAGSSHSSHARAIDAALALASRLLIAAALLVVPPIGLSQTEREATTAAGGVDVRALDGMSFKGMFGPKGGEPRDEDTFIFADGKFTSTGCIDYGFAPRPYWVRVDDGVMHFLAEMVSDEHGVIVYTGTVRDDAIDATYVWTKRRWYWNVEREFWFKGARVEP